MALYWYRKGAENGDSDAIVDLGRLYTEGNVVERDVEQAFELFKRASEQDNARGQYLLGYSYLEGDVELDYEKAFELFKKASEADVVPAMARLGSMYFYGIGCEQDYHQAVYWLTKCIENEEYADADTLAACYEFGYGVEKDVEKAIELYKSVIKAAEEDVVITNMAHDALVRLGVEEG